MWKQTSMVLVAGCSSVWWRRGILGQPFQADKVAICLLLRLMAYWAPTCHHALPLSALGTPPQRGGAKAKMLVLLDGWWTKRRTRNGTRRIRIRRRRRREVKGCGLSPGGSPSHPPFQPVQLPLLPNLSPAARLHTMAASLLKFHVIGSQAWSFVLSQCLGSGACCRGDTLCKLRAGKPFLLSLASKRGELPLHTQSFFSIVCFLQHFSRVSNQRKAVFNLL